MIFHRTLTKLASILVNFVVMLISITCIFPVIWVLYSSFKTKQEFSLSIISLPSHISFENYRMAFNDGHINKYFVNSVFITCVTVAVIVFIGFITGYCFSRCRFRGRGILYGIFLSGMLIPTHSLLIPIFIEFKQLGLLDKRITLLFPYIALGLPIAIFLFDSFVRTVPIEMEEAAFIDGVPIFRTIFQIIMPICRPAIATVIILSFLQWWNEFSFALVLINSDKFKTVPLGLSNFMGAMSSNYTELMAAMTVAITPVIIVYLLFYKKIIQGMAMGAVKG